MMKELHTAGPFVVSFDVDYEFMVYKSGIYHAIQEEDWVRNGQEKPEWRAVSHSVLLVGWGVENG